MKARFYVILISSIFLFSCNQQQFNQQLAEYGNPKKPIYDAVIVPGYPYKEGKTWNTLLKNRLVWAKHLYETGKTSKIIFSGGAVHSKYMECKVMKKYAVAMGIPENAILLDSLAKHTTENLFYGYKISKEQQYKRIAVASDPYQTTILSKFIRKLNLKKQIKVRALPYTDRMVQLEMLITKEPKVDLKDCVTNDFIPLKQKDGKLKSILGTFGQNVNWSEL